MGWGGYWAWDPVENASFMPWLTGTAFLHSIIIQEKKGMLRTWNMILILTTFIRISSYEVRSNSSSLKSSSEREMFENNLKIKSELNSVVNNGLEINQNTTAVRGATQQAVSSQVAEMYRIGAENERIAELVSKAFQDISKTSSRRRKM